MAADPVRRDAYARALARVVRPGSVVVDLGAGTGMLSLLAAQLGAKRVHAMEMNPAVHLLPELARQNGLEDRIVVHTGSALEATIPERADVVVSDLRGSFPLHGDHVSLLVDARTRLLAPGGALLPARDVLHVTGVESEGMARALALGWSGLAQLGFGADPLRRSVLNSAYADRPSPLAASDVVTTSEHWATLDYATLSGGPVSGTVTLEVVRRGSLHGFAISFEAHVTDGVRYTTAPGNHLVYGRTFLPTEPIDVAAGERIAVTLRVDDRGEQWAWDWELRDHAETVRARARQSTFLGVPTSPEALLRLASGNRPALAAGGTRARRVLDACDGVRSVDEIVELVASAEPSVPREQIRREVRDLVERFTR